VYDSITKKKGGIKQNSNNLSINIKTKKTHYGSE